MTTSTLERAEAALDAPPATLLRVPAGVRLVVGPGEFEDLCAANRDLRLERTGRGELIVMSPAGSNSGRRNAKLSVRLGTWNEAAGLGEAFDSSTGFTFPDGSVLAPDAAWATKARWDALSPAEQERFARLAPDFVAELRSPSDDLPDAQAKMRQYVAHGVRLAWLIDPITAAVEIHRPGREVETLQRPATLSGEDVLPGFTLDLKGILFD